MTMINREKFTVFENEDISRTRIQVNATEAIKKRETAAEPTDGSTDMTSYADRLGRPIQVGIFIQTLKRLNPALIFQLSLGDPSKYGIYIKDYKTDLTTNRPVLSDDLRFITGMESGITLGGRINEGIMPEFSIIENVDQIVPDGDSVKKVKRFAREIRGWRTVLAALHLDGLLTEPQIEANFKISEGKDSSNWQKRMGKKL